MLLWIFEHNVLSFPQIMGRGLLHVPAFRIPKQLVKHYDKHIMMISSQQISRYWEGMEVQWQFQFREKHIALLYKWIFVM
jgi:hypothetical protein